MRILALADEPAQKYYDYYREGCLKEFDLIIACGDLSKNYLEFVATMARCPLLYVRGNHDDRFEEDPPLGCFCIEDQIYVYKGVRILGLGGSYRYRPDGKNMYTERAMQRRIRRLWFKLRKHKGFDILVTHAPIRGVNDEEAIAHRGFEAFRDLIDKYHPKYVIHGHMHKNYGIRIPQVTPLGSTTVINAFEYCKIDYAPLGRSEPRGRS